MDINTKYVIGIVVSALVLVGIFLFINSKTNGVAIKDNPELDSLAMCIKDKGTIFYGAFWCPHCKATKEMFGSGAKYLPYKECSTADGASQVKECTDKGVEGYPTWVFADGTRLSGETTLNTLSLRTGCPLPPDLSDGTPDASSGSSSPAVSGASTTPVSTGASSPIKLQL